MDLFGNNIFFLKFNYNKKRRFCQGEKRRYDVAKTAGDRLVAPACRKFTLYENGHKPPPYGKTIEFSQSIGEQERHHFPQDSPRVIRE
ncbi:MAG: hypothetical protein IKA44_04770 [Clostridia bacterium]|nr:hypothetical protein [Clostridia bacterium]